jgi:hypothetical protein
VKSLSNKAKPTRLSADMVRKYQDLHASNTSSKEGVVKTLCSGKVLLAMLNTKTMTLLR